jgi:hypothetical protein
MKTFFKYVLYALIIVFVYMVGVSIYEANNAPEVTEVIAVEAE